ncbi:TPA: hypothetical protein I7665_18350 [Vibrio vulnificus]|uniref:Coenzyme F420 hydrogenase/dehydrogenase, beta subunit C-terminal domain n=1 Tax=Vibrio vulnificus TaxID=672 RepID=UPI0009283B5A|nr:Coenzyme F420 hydrogenase/dehydrogenase, beta subunit C-terminal domain [Vibrio vulnificus]EHZ2550970.1 Coenzyme F420 hydrogenase/dehydrogenase, beta subunit C-terminal domain [Vibrio vulnificus]OJI37244.1 coenzyme F420-reducing hydrogenase subunit beta [Vibrio vulnificus]HAS8124066.1 hypothetical protein [Vibrio vulnificus]
MNIDIREVVTSGLCVGCGACTFQSAEENIMEMSSSGIYQPKDTSFHRLESSVCPFANKIDHKGHEYLGEYTSLLAGYASDFRSSSSSGGVASWVLERLMKDGLVDKIICVGADEQGRAAYRIIDDIKKIRNNSKTKYYPLTMESIIKYVLKSKGERFAITAIPCFVNAIHLLKKENEIFRHSVKYLVGIFCGGMKSKYFTEYLSEKSGVHKENIKSPEYRVKGKLGDSASNYSFQVKNAKTNETHTMPMSVVGDMWGTGMFKPLACDFCEDLCSENADISFGDAWIPPYNNDYQGNNVVIVRNSELDARLKLGIEDGELFLDRISEKQMCDSQAGNITHRRKGLAHRLSLDSKDYNHLNTEPKRDINPIISLVQHQRSIVREKSQRLWVVENNVRDFEYKMLPYKRKLMIYTRINHFTRVSFWKRVAYKIFGKTNGR